MIMTNIIEASIIPGLIYGLGSVGLAFIFKFLKFPDLTVLGSIMVGGVTCLWATGLTNPFFGIVAGTIAGGCLGCVTGLIAKGLRIDPILASIITFTGSSSVGFYLCHGGQIGLPKGAWSLLHPTFTFSDLFIVILCIVAICALSSFLIQTPFGSLVLAMTGDPRFVCFRHRFYRRTFILVLILGNALVGFAGALFALRVQTAYVQSHADFLPFSLGAIFGSNALVAWLIHKLNSNSPQTATATRGNSGTEPSAGPRGLSKILSNARDATDPKRFAIVSFAYVLGSLFLYCITAIVSSNGFSSLLPFGNIPQAWHHLTEASIILFCVWWASGSERTE